MKRRSEMRKNKRAFNGKYGLSNVCKCGQCGSALYRVHWYLGGKKVMWRCRNRMDNGTDACDLKSIDNELIQKAVVKAVNQLLANRCDVIKAVKANIMKVVGVGGNNLTGLLDSRITDLERRVVECVKSGKDYSQLLEKINSLKAERERMLKTDIECRTESEMLSGVMAFLDAQSGNIEEYDDALTRKLIQEIEVHDERVLITFKHGQSVEVNI